MSEERTVSTDRPAAAKPSIEAEVEQLGRLQRQLLPSEPPSVSGWRIFDKHLPSRLAGGDYYDYFRIDESRVGIAIGDASGHGPPAAVLMAMTKMALQASGADWSSPSRLLGRAGELLDRLALGSEFMTILYGVLDSADSTFTFSSAGHWPPLVFGPDRSGAPELELHCELPLGLVGRNECEERTFEFAPGDRLLLFTDGIFEEQNSNGELFGSAKFHDLVAQNADCPAEAVNEKLIAAVRDFAGAQSFRDDIALVLIERLSES